MNTKAKELKQQKKQAIIATTQAKIKANMLKIKECLMNNDQSGVDYYTTLNEKLGVLLK